MNPALSCKPVQALGQGYLREEGTGCKKICRALVNATRPWAGASCFRSLRNWSPYVGGGEMCSSIFCHWALMSGGTWRMLWEVLHQSHMAAGPHVGRSRVRQLLRVPANSQWNLARWAPGILHQQDDNSYRNNSPLHLSTGIDFTESFTYMF